MIGIEPSFHHNRPLEAILCQVGPLDGDAIGKDQLAFALPQTAAVSRQSAGCCAGMLVRGGNAADPLIISGPGGYRSLATEMRPHTTSGD